MNKKKKKPIMKSGWWFFRKSASPSEEILELKDKLGAEIEESKILLRTITRLKDEIKAELVCTDEQILRNQALKIAETFESHNHLAGRIRSERKRFEELLEESKLLIKTQTIFAQTKSTEN